MVGPVRMNQDLRSIPYVPAKTKKTRRDVDALCAPEYRADKRPIRIQNFWPGVCPSNCLKISGAQLQRCRVHC